MYLATGVEPTKLTAATDGCDSSTSTASLSPCTMLNTPAGSPASMSISPSKSRAQRDSLRRFQNERVATGDAAMGNIHIGTIDGKLNGVMPAQTPTGCRIVSAINVACDVRQVGSHQHVRNAQWRTRRLRFPAGPGACFGGRLAMLAADQFSDFVEPSEHYLAV